MIQRLLRPFIATLLTAALVWTSGEGAQAAVLLADPSLIHSLRPRVVRPIIGPAFFTEQAIVQRLSNSDALGKLPRRTLLGGYLAAGFLALAGVSAASAQPAPNTKTNERHPGKKVTRAELYKSVEDVETLVKKLDDLWDQYKMAGKKLIKDFDTGYIDPDYGKKVEGADHNLRASDSDARLVMQIALFVARAKAANIAYDPNILMLLKTIKETIASVQPVIENAYHVRAQSSTIALNDKDQITAEEYKKLFKRLKNAAPAAEKKAATLSVKLPPEIPLGQTVIVASDSEGFPFRLTFGNVEITNGPLANVERMVELTNLGIDPVTKIHQFLQVTYYTTHAKAYRDTFMIVERVGINPVSAHLAYGYQLRVNESSLPLEGRFHGERISQTYGKHADLIELLKLSPLPGSSAPTLEEVDRTIKSIRETEEPLRQAIAALESLKVKALQDNDLKEKAVAYELGKGSSPQLPDQALADHGLTKYREDVHAARALAAGDPRFVAAYETVQSAARDAEQRIIIGQNALAYFNPLPDYWPSTISQQEIARQRAAFLKAVKHSRQAQKEALAKLPVHLPADGQYVNIINVQQLPPQVIVTYRNFGPSHEKPGSILMVGDIFTSEHWRQKGLDNYQRETQFVIVDANGDHHVLQTLPSINENGPGSLGQFHHRQLEDNPRGEPTSRPSRRNMFMFLRAFPIFILTIVSVINAVSAAGAVVAEKVIPNRVSVAGFAQSANPHIRSDGRFVLNAPSRVPSTPATDPNGPIVLEAPNPHAKGITGISERARQAQNHHFVNRLLHRLTSNNQDTFDQALEQLKRLEVRDLNLRNSLIDRLSEIAQSAGGTREAALRPAILRLQGRTAASSATANTAFPEPKTLEERLTKLYGMAIQLSALQEEVTKNASPRPRLNDSRHRDLEQTADQLKQKMVRLMDDILKESPTALDRSTNRRLPWKEFDKFRKGNKEPAPKSKRSSNSGATYSVYAMYSGPVGAFFVRLAAPYFDLSPWVGIGALIVAIVWLLKNIFPSGMFRRALLATTIASVASVSLAQENQTPNIPSVMPKAGAPLVGVKHASSMPKIEELADALRDLEQPSLREDILEARLRLNQKLDLIIASQDASGDPNLTFDSKLPHDIRRDLLATRLYSANRDSKDPSINDIFGSFQTTISEIRKKIDHAERLFNMTWTVRYGEKDSLQGTFTGLYDRFNKDKLKLEEVIQQTEPMGILPGTEWMQVVSTKKYQIHLTYMKDRAGAVHFAQVEWKNNLFSATRTYKHLVDGQKTRLAHPAQVETYKARPVLDPSKPAVTFKPKPIKDDDFPWSSRPGATIGGNTLLQRFMPMIFTGGIVSTVIAAMATAGQAAAETLPMSLASPDGLHSVAVTAMQTAASQALPLASLDLTSWMLSLNPDLQAVIYTLLFAAAIVLVLVLIARHSFGRLELGGDLLLRRKIVREELPLPFQNLDSALIRMSADPTDELPLRHALENLKDYRDSEREKRRDSVHSQVPASHLPAAMSWRGAPVLGSRLQGEIPGERLPANSYPVESGFMGKFFPQEAINNLLDEYPVLADRYYDVLSKLTTPNTWLRDPKVARRILEIRQAFDKGVPEIGMKDAVQEIIQKALPSQLRGIAQTLLGERPIGRADGVFLWDSALTEKTALARRALALNLLAQIAFRGKDRRSFKEFKQWLVKVDPNFAQEWNETVQIYKAANTPLKKLTGRGGLVHLLLLGLIFAGTGLAAGPTLHLSALSSGVPLGLVLFLVILVGGSVLGIRQSIRSAKLAGKYQPPPGGQLEPFINFNECIQRLRENPRDPEARRLVQHSINELRSWIYSYRRQRNGSELPMMEHIDFVSVLDLMQRDFRIADWLDTEMQTLFINLPDNYAAYARHVLDVIFLQNCRVEPLRHLLSSIVILAWPSHLQALADIFLFEFPSEKPDTFGANSAARRETGILLLSEAIERLRHWDPDAVGQFLENLSENDVTAYNEIVQRVYGPLEKSRSDWFRSLVEQIEQSPSKGLLKRMFLGRYHYPRIISPEELHVQPEVSAKTGLSKRVKTFLVFVIVATIVVLACAAIGWGVPGAFASAGPSAQPFDDPRLQIVTAGGSVKFAELLSRIARPKPLNDEVDSPKTRTAFDEYWYHNDLSPYRHLRAAVTPQVESCLLHDGALRPVFLIRLSPDQLGPLQILNPDMVSAIGGSDLLERYSGFLPGSPKMANKLAQQGYEIFVGVTDQSTFNTLHSEQKVANGRQVYFPLADGTWLSAKGEGQFRDPSRPPHYWNNDDVTPRHMGVATESEAKHMIEALPLIKAHPQYFVQPLAYRQLLALPNGEGGFVSADTLDAAVRGTPLAPCLIFNHVLEPHRLVKLPQLLESDPELQELRQRLSPLLIASGEVSLPSGSILPASLLMQFISGRMGRAEGLKQRARLFKKTLHLQDITWAGEEADNEEFLNAQEYLKSELAKKRIHRFENVEWFQKTGMASQGINAKIWNFLNLMIYADKHNLRTFLFPAPEALLEALLSGYFKYLSDDHLTLWTIVDSDTKTSPALQAVIDAHPFRLDVFHSRSRGFGHFDRLLDIGMKQLITEWAKREQNKRFALVAAEQADGIPRGESPEQTAVIEGLPRQIRIFLGNVDTAIRNGKPLEDFEDILQGIHRLSPQYWEIVLQALLLESGAADGIVFIFGRAIFNHRLNMRADSFLRSLRETHDSIAERIIAEVNGRYVAEMSFVLRTWKRFRKQHLTLFHETYFASPMELAEAA